MNFVSGFGKEGETGEKEEDVRLYAYIDVNNEIVNIDELKENFSRGELEELSSIEILKEKVNSEEYEAGFVIKSYTEYDYVVKNNKLYENDNSSFEYALKKAFRIHKFEEMGMNYEDVEGLINPEIKSETIILGKDSASNYLYTYLLTFGLYFLIILYGQFTATAVATEKGNRTMEILITSTKSRNLIFGKVLGSAAAGVLQFAVILLTAKVFYEINAEAWDYKLDFLFNVPSEVLLNFSIFGILGYLFYSFIFGALGALVSRSEDINSSSTPVTLLFIVVFFVTAMGMQNTEWIILKIFSYLPFSSSMAMFVRISMGTVSNLEIIISLLILIVSTVLVGFFGAMIYRLGSLMYGNPVKLREAIKMLRDQ
jgi:ABC-2 type transport system permease protein